MAVPFHEFLSRVRPGSGVPADSVYVTLLFTCLIALIIVSHLEVSDSDGMLTTHSQIGSTTAFNIILSVSATGLFTSYLTVICTVLAKRIRREPFPPSRFNLGKFGAVANVLAICFLILAYFFLFFPQVPHPDPADMNWAILVYGVVVIFAFTYYIFKGRHEYDGPVEYIRKDL